MEKGFQSNKRATKKKKPTAAGKLTWVLQQPNGGYIMNTNSEEGVAYNTHNREGDDVLCHTI